MPNFVHLHVHSHFSLQDATCKIGDLVRRVKELGMSSVALTDHGNMCGCLEFYEAARQNGIKPIIGCELYVAHENAELKSRQGPAGIAYHLVALARDFTGYQNLIKLSSYGYIQGFYYKPRVDRNVLAQHSEGLIIMSACLQGEPAVHLLGNDWASAEETVQWYQNTFGKENYYLELMNHGIDEQKTVFPMLIELSKKTGAPLVATNDIHYLNEDDARSHEILYCLQNKTTLSDPNHRHFSTNEFYLKTAEEMREAFMDYPEAVDMAAEIANRCNLEIKYDKYHLPQYVSPKGKNPDEYLRDLAETGLHKRYPSITEEIKERFEYEYDVIRRMGFSSYFLIVWDFVNYAKSNGIPVGPGRGSGAGSLLAYALGITNVDPMKYDLLFERFLNPERISMPDFDIDFCEARRSNVLDYVKQKYSEDNVCQIITFSSLKAKAAVRDVGRVMDVPLSKVDIVAKLVETDDIAEALKASRELKSMYDQEPLVRDWLDNCKRLQGIHRHASTHAAGVVIADKPLINYVPFFRNRDDITIQFDMGSLEKVKLLKMDFLGLKNLTLIDRCVNLIKETTGKDLDLENIPLDDKATFELLQEGKSAGVFQMESTGFQELLTRARPDKFTDLIALNALYRPGPLRSGMVDSFINRKNGIEEITYLDDSLKPILEETYGVIVFQEQVMRISNIIGGFSLGEADMLRKAMSKKTPEVMAQFEDKFISGAARIHNINKKHSKTVFELIKHFGGYGFNKSHSTAYALLAFQTAYLKANYTRPFMAALLSSWSGDTDKVSKYIAESKTLNIKILPPDINESYSDFTVSEKAIRFGLSAVKNVGQKAVEAIINARSEHGSFSSIFDFTNNVDLRSVNNKVIESLIMAGAFDSTGAHRSQLLAGLEHAVEIGNISQKDRQQGQSTLFDIVSEESTSISATLPDVPKWDDHTQLLHEKEMLGFYVSGHPLTKYEELIVAFSSSNIQSLSDSDGDKEQEVTLGCYIDKCKMLTSKRTNEPMASLLLEDLSGNIKAILFPAIYRDYGKYISEGKVVFIKGLLEKDYERASIRVNQVIPIHEALRFFTKKIVLRMSEIGLQDDLLKKIQTIASAHHGQCPLMFELKTRDGHCVTLQSGRLYFVMPSNKVYKEFADLLGRENISFST